MYVPRRLLARRQDPKAGYICANCLLRPLQLRRRTRSIHSTTVQIPPTSTTSFDPINSIPTTHSAPGSKHDDALLRSIFDNRGLWKDFSSTTKPLAQRSGLFQNKYLTSPAGFMAFTTRSLKQAQRLVDKVVKAESQKDLISIVKDLDRLSDLLCRVIDMSDFVRSTHPERKIVMAADEAYSTMYEYMNVLNTTTGLYRSLRKAMADSEVVRHWSREERVVANLLLKDFEKSGINLPRASREKFVALSNDIAQLGPMFVNEKAPAKDILTFESSRLNGMDPMIVRELSRNGKVSLPTMDMAAHHALYTAEDGNVRREIYKATHTSSQRQLEILETMLKKRVELARLVGRDSYAESTLADKMAKTPEAVIHFLKSLAASTRPATVKEYEQLSALKDAHLGKHEPFQVWDREFYHARMSYEDSKNKRGYSSDAISSYFSLGTVMQGLSRLFTRLYGVRFVPHETLPGETWNSTVRRLDVISEEDGHIAVVYCDLFEREGKNPNPAHFTLRCSRLISEDEILEDTLHNGGNDGMPTSRKHGKLYQLPTIALICDFSSSSPNKPTLLSFREVTTLFHEMGHAIHSILGRTDLHNVAGTRCATDIAELPSVLMEHFAKSPEVLRLYARHWDTDQPLPLELLENDSLLPNSETYQQIILALLDQELHSHLAAESSFDSTKIYTALQQKYDVLPPMAGTSWQGFFGHLFGYGATYYSYMFDNAIADKVWREVFESDPTRRESGEKYKEELLKWGGGRDPWACVAGVLGREDLQEGGVKAMEEIGKWGTIKSEGG